MDAAFGLFNSTFTEVSPPLQKALTDPLILIGTSSYLLLAPLLRRSPLVDTRKGAYKRCMIAYNTLMAVYSLGCFLVTTTALGWDYGYGGWLRALTGDQVVELYSNTCPSPVWESTLFVWAAKSFYYSKYVEYLDTAWLVLKGKPVSFLQTFHHFGAPWDVYLGLALKNEGLWIFMFLNAFIHTLMYTYYGLTAAGYRIPFKPLMTIMQLFQFCCGFTIVWEYIYIPCFRADQGMVFSWAFNYFYVGTVLLLFMHFFYMDNFQTRPRASTGTAKKKKSI